VARVARRGAWGGRDGDHDARLPDLDAADAVVDRGLAEAVLRGQVGCEPREHGLGHLLEGLVFEVEHVAVARAPPYGTDERCDGTGVGTRNLVDDAREVERLVGDAERAARHRRDERDLVTIVERDAAVDVLTVQRVQQPRRLVAETGLRPDVVDRLDTVELEPPERPEDPAVRRANLRRVAHLFRPYRGRLAAVLALIVFSAGLGVIPAFLLKEILNTAIPTGDTTLLAYLAGGMILIAIAS